MKRLFFALWPSQSVRAKIDALNQHIKLPDVRHLKPQNLHLTLLYLGMVDAAIQQAIVSEVDNIAATRFAFTLDGISHWREPRIVCLTVSQQPKPMLDLVQALTAIVKPYPIFLHDRPYRAHVTMVRKARQPYVLQVPHIHWEASEFVLVESCSTPDGIRYEVLQSWPLKRAI